MKNAVVARKIAKDVLTVLGGRAGFDHWWFDIDEDIQADIIDELAETIRHHLDDASIIFEE